MINGVLMPKLRNRFHIEFRSNTGELLELSPKISNQIVSFCYHTGSGYFIFADDVCNQALFSIQELMNSEKHLQIWVCYLDGASTVIAVSKLEGVNIETMELTCDLDYACGPQQTTTSIRYQDIGNNTFYTKIIDFLKNLYIETRTPIFPTQVQRKVVFTHSSVTECCTK